MKTELVKIIDLKEGDIFSFRTKARPIWWRFIELIQEAIIYEEIKSKFKHTSDSSFCLVLKKSK